jgi:hypothetical protein
MYVKDGLGHPLIMTIATNAKLQAMNILFFPYYMGNRVRMCSTSGFPELNSDRNLMYWLHQAPCRSVAVMLM